MHEAVEAQFGELSVAPRLSLVEADDRKWDYFLMAGSLNATQQLQE